MISEDQVVGEVFNKLFINIVPILKISTNHNYDADFLVTNDKLANALNKFRNHPSVVIIQNKRKTDQCFPFGPVTYENILQETDNLDTATASQQSDISPKILKQSSDYFACYFRRNVNQCISKSMLPADLKLADVAPVYEKK